MTFLWPGNTALALIFFIGAWATASGIMFVTLGGQVRSRSVLALS